MKTGNIQIEIENYYQKERISSLFSSVRPNMKKALPGLAWKGF